MSLAARIHAAGLAPEHAYAFQLGLEELGGNCALPAPVERFVRDTLGPLVGDCATPAPFEDLWPYGELFLSVAILLAVATGAYDVDKTRAVGAMAARLGVSAGELAKIEDRVFAELKEAPEATQVRLRRGVFG